MCIQGTEIKFDKKMQESVVRKNRVQKEKLIYNIQHFFKGSTFRHLLPTLLLLHHVPFIAFWKVHSVTQIWCKMQ